MSHAAVVLLTVALAIRNFPMVEDKASLIVRKQAFVHTLHIQIMSIYYPTVDSNLKGEE